jgi:WD40 repeat protein
MIVPDQVDYEEERAVELDDEFGEEPVDEGRAFGCSKPWMGGIHPPSDWDPTTYVSEPPNVTASLEFVHGYHGRGCRDNVKWIKSPDVFLYCAAGVVVIYNHTEHKQTFFVDHGEEVACLDYNHKTKMGVSGGVGERFTAPIYVWSVDEVTYKMTKVHHIHGFHQFNVTSINFSPDGSRICSLGADKNYSIAIHSTKTGLLLASSTGDSNKIIEVKFNTCDWLTNHNNHVVSVGFHHLKLWTIHKEGLMESEPVNGVALSEEIICTVSSKDDYIYCGTLAGTLIIIGYNAPPIDPAPVADKFDYPGKKAKSTVIKSTTRLQKYKQVFEFPAHPSQVCAIAHTRKHFITGGKDGMIRVWDSIACAKGHPEVLRAIDVKNYMGVSNIENGIRALSCLKHCIVVGTVLNHIYMINEEDGTHKCIVQGHWGEPSNLNEGTELWGLDAHPRSPLYCSLGGDGVLRVWKAETNLQISMHLFPHAGICCSYSPDGKYIACGFGTGHMIVVDANTLDPIVSKKRKQRITVVQFSPNLAFLASASASCNIDIYSANGDFGLIGVCTGHNSNLMSLDWNEDSTVLVSCSRSYEVLYHSVPECRQITSSSMLRDERWRTETSLFGWNVQGIWQLGDDGSAINTCCRSLDKKYLATGGDDQCVRIFKSPCVGNRLGRKDMAGPAPSIDLIGHSSHVTNTRWLVGGQHLVTTGGADTCIFRWKITEKPTKPTSMDGTMRGGATLMGTSFFGRSTKLEYANTYTEKGEAMGQPRGNADRRKTYQFVPLRVDVGSVRTRVLRQTKSSAMMAAEAKKQREHIEKTRVHKCCPMYPV